MAFTPEQENALLALLNKPLVTLNELPPASEINDDDLFLTRQHTMEKAVTGERLKNYFSPLATLTKRGTVQLSNAVDSDSESTAVTSQALNTIRKLVQASFEEQRARIEEVDSKVTLLDSQAIKSVRLVGEMHLYRGPGETQWFQVPSGYVVTNIYQSYRTAEKDSWSSHVAVKALQVFVNNQWVTING